MANAIDIIFGKLKKKKDELVNDNKGFIQQGKFTFQPVKNTFNTLKNNNLIGINTYGASKVKNIQSAKDFTTGLKQSPVFQFGQTLGQSSASPFITKTLQQNTQQYSQNINTALKMANQSKTQEERQRWMNLANQNQQFSQQGSTNVQQDYNKTPLQIAGEGLGTAATVIGGAKVTPKTALTMAGISGGINKIQGGSFAQGAGTGLAYAPVYAGVAQFTNPLLSKVVNFTPVKAQTAGRLVSGLSNVGQGIVSDISTGQKTTPLSRGIDLATGIVGGKTQFDTGVKVKGMNSTLDIRDKTLLNELKQRFKLISPQSPISPENYSIAEQFVEMAKKKYGLDSYPGWKTLDVEKKLDVIDGRMEEYAREIGKFSMGLTDNKQPSISTPQIKTKQDFINKLKEISPGQPENWYKNQAEINFKQSQISPDGKVINQQKGTGLQKELTQNKQSQIVTDNLSTSVRQNSDLSATEKTKIVKTLKDNSPTVSISKKGKLNTERLDITPEQKAQLDELQNNVPVTVIGNKDVIENAKLTKGSKKIMTDEVQKKLISQQLNSRQEVVSLQKQYDKLVKSGASEEELIALKSKIIDQSAIARQEGTLAGRLLQARNILANEMATPEQKIYALLDNAGVDRNKYLKDAIGVDFNNATDVVNFYRKYVPATFKEVLDEVRYTNMLSSPLTQIVNTFSNVLQSGFVKPVEKTITGQLDWVKSKLTGSERQYYASQGIDYAKGYWKALPEAWTKFKNIASGKEMSLTPNLENIPTANKGILKWYTTPLRTLEASDQFFRTLVKSGETSSLAKLNLSPTELAKRAEQSADYTLFRQKFDPNGELGQGNVLKVWDTWNSTIQNVRKVPGGKWILPFIQTPTNILKQGVEYSPLGLTTMIGSKKPLEQLSKAILGTSVFLGAYGLADSGLTTWAVPTNAKDKELFYAAGMQPYSIKIGDNYVSYSKIGPLAYPIAMAAALKDAEKQNPDQSTMADVGDGAASMLGFFGDQSYVESIGDLIDTIKSASDKKLAYAAKSEASNLLGQLVPYKSFMGWLTRMVDPVYRKPEGITQQITSQIPGLSTGVGAYTDMAGNESKRDYPVLNSFSPLKVTQEKSSAKSLYDSQQNYRVTKNQEKQIMSDLEKSGGTKAVGNTYYYTDSTSGEVKKVDLSKVQNMPESTAMEKALKKKASYALIDNVLDNLPVEQQAEALTKLGVNENEAQYYNIARQTDDIKYAYIQDLMQTIATSGGDRNVFLNALKGGRVGINDKTVVSNGVLDQLYEDGFITYAERKALKNLDTSGTTKTTGRTSTKSTLAKIKAVNLSKYNFDYSTNVSDSTSSNLTSFKLPTFNNSQTKDYTSNAIDFSKLQSNKLR